MISTLIVLRMLQAPVIFGSVTIFGLLSWYFTPEDKWLRKDQVVQAMNAANVPITTRG